MSEHSNFSFEEMGVGVNCPHELQRVHEQRLLNLSPWHVMSREQVAQRLKGLRGRYSRPYVPFASRQDNDDIACLEASRPGQVVIVHDFASEGSEVRGEYDSFWAWFRSAVEDMILFE